MRRVTYVHESVLVGDEFGSLILEYAAALARNNASEPLHFVAVGQEGPVETAFLLGPASQLLVVKTSVPLPEPDNTAAVEYMRRRIRQLAFPMPAPLDGSKIVVSQGMTDD